MVRQSPLRLARLSEEVVGMVPKSVNLLDQLALSVADVFPREAMVDGMDVAREDVRLVLRRVRPR